MSPSPRRESSRLYGPRDVRAGATILLQVCEEEWGDWPAERCFDVPWTAPAEWNADALRAVIKTVLTARGDREDANIVAAQQGIGRQTYFALKFGRYRHIHGRDTYVQKDVPFLHFGGLRSQIRYAVALPKFPYAAVAGFLEHEHAVEIDVSVGPANILHDWPGPAPRVLDEPRKKAARRAKKGAAR
jgi:hypothetical protein